MWHVWERERMGACSVLVGKIEGKKTLGKSCVDGRIIFKWT
jgi:hypothetical protein